MFYHARQAFADLGKAILELADICTHRIHRLLIILLLEARIDVLVLFVTLSSVMSVFGVRRVLSAVLAEFLNLLLLVGSALTLTISLLRLARDATIRIHGLPAPTVVGVAISTIAKLVTMLDSGLTASFKANTSVKKWPTPCCAQYALVRG